MSSKKATKKSGKASLTTRRAVSAKTSRAARPGRRDQPDTSAAANKTGQNGDAPPRPTYIAGESAEEREKRLAAKKALTLKVFQMAYESHQRRRKAS